jgi:hypothetical protein
MFAETLIDGDWSRARRMIEYQVICMYRVGRGRNLTDKQARELHTHPSVVLTLLNADQHLDRYVKVLVDGKVRGYQTYKAGKRVTLEEVS